MHSRLQDSVADRRYHSRLMGMLAVLTLILILRGVFGVVSRRVLDRQRELGIRMALGSSRARVFALILKQGLGPVLAGIGLGWMASLTLRGVLSGLLFGVSASDPPVFLGVGALLLLAAALACYLPARKAMRLDPVAALRCE